MDKQMYKVVQINTVYNTGSTGKIVASIESVSNSEGIRTYVAYGRGKIDNNPHHFRIGNKLDFYTHVMMNFCGRNGFGSRLVTKRFLRWLDVVEPDLIHLHNIHGFYINIELLFECIKAKRIPVIWTLHDCWPFTGHCAYFDYANCNKWVDGCNSCPIIKKDYPYSIFVDNCERSYIRKRASFKDVDDMVIVTPSQWLANKVRYSFLNDYPIRVIPNGINLDAFRIKRISNPSKERIILSVANIWDKRKGLEYVLGLSQWFNHENGYRIVIIGLNKNQINKLEKRFCREDVLPLQRTKTQEELVDWYNRAMVFVNPTLQDNYPTTNLESVACGTPVVTFQTGGSPETIDSTCGIVVEKGNLIALKEAIERIIEVDKEEIITNCIKKSRQYDNKLCFDEYIKLYYRLLDRTV